MDYYTLPDTLLDRVLEQIKEDVEAGDMTAIAELLSKVPEKDFLGFLSEKATNNI